MSNPVRPKDLIAPVLLWALVLTGCVFKDVTPPHRAALVACGPLALAAAAANR